MNEPSHTFKLGAILLALLIGGGCVFLAGAILLPSTKRAHFDFSSQPRDEDATPSATTQPTSAPARP